MTRPPPIIADDTQIRHDINSIEMKKAYPFLPTSTLENRWELHEQLAKKRQQMLEIQDAVAYEELKVKHNIDFKPPNRT